MEAMLTGKSGPMGAVSLAPPLSYPSSLLIRSSSSSSGIDTNQVSCIVCVRSTYRPRRNREGKRKCSQPQTRITARRVYAMQYNDSNSPLFSVTQPRGYSVLLDGKRKRTPPLCPSRPPLAQKNGQPNPSLRWYTPPFPASSLSDSS